MYMTTVATLLNVPAFSMMTFLMVNTLFPYTTLFRSDAETAWLTRNGLMAWVVRTTREPHGISPFLVRDRKSTRLNSSHQIISYAVFCLKKKSGCARRITC